MINVILATQSHLRYRAGGRCTKEATAVIYTLELEGKNKTHGIAILYPDESHKFFVEGLSMDAKMLWRSMYIASEMLYVGTDAVKLAILIAGDTPVSDPLFKNAGDFLSLDHTVESLRKIAFDQVIPASDLNKINESFGHTSSQKKPAAKNEAFKIGTKGQIAFLTSLIELRNNAVPRVAA